jgi:hypothetical protein
MSENEAMEHSNNKISYLNVILPKEFMGASDEVGSSRVSENFWGKDLELNPQFY